MNNWKRLILGCTVGNVFELYDFILYAYFSTIIGLLFFPTDNKFVANLLAFSVFATGCLMRPIGAIIFGLLGDRLGRKKALVVSVGLMTFSTAFIGVLPTYSMIGALAPTLLVINRLLQGLSMCGEEVGAAIYLMESAPSNRRCFAGSIILGGIYLGLILASIIAFVTVQVTSDDVLHTWGWRIPFILAIPFGFLALYIRLKQPETEIFNQAIKKQTLSSNPVASVLKQFRSDLIRGILITSLLAVMTYLYVVYLPSYISQHFHLGLPKTMLISAANFSITAIVALLAGILSDKQGYQRVMQMTCIAIFVLIYPVFSFLYTHTLLGMLMSELTLSITVGFIAGSLMPFLISPFPTELRFIGAAIIFNISMTIFGSSAPIIMLFFSKSVHAHLLSSIYIMLIVSIAFFTSMNFKVTKMENAYV